MASGRLSRTCPTRAAATAQNSWREEYRRLEASLERLSRERSQLREEAETANMDPAEARRTLLAKAKEHNAQLGDVKKSLREEQDKRAGVEEKLRDVETQLQQRRSSSADGSKVCGCGCGCVQGEGGGGAVCVRRRAHPSPRDAGLTLMPWCPAQVEMLVQRDREMTRYIEEEYPERMESAQKSVEEKRDTVVALLEHISGELQRKDNLPTCVSQGQRGPISLPGGGCGCADPARRKERVEDMTGDLSFKKGQMDLSKQTLSRLQAERANTEKELAKMRELDQRVPRQVHQLKDDCTRCEAGTRSPCARGSSPA